MDMVVLADGSLLAVFRLDAGDGRTHPYLPYYEVTTTACRQRFSLTCRQTLTGQTLPTLPALSTLTAFLWAAVFTPVACCVAEPFG